MKSWMMSVAFFCSTPAWAIQYIDCIPMPVEGNDKVIVSLKDHQTGTLFISSGIASDGTTEDTGVLTLVRTTAASSLAAFSAKNAFNTFTFLMPVGLVQQRHDGYFEAAIELRSKDGAYQGKYSLNCFTRLYL